MEEVRSMENKNDKRTIDLAQIAKKLWPHRRTYYFVLPTALIVTFLLTICVPRYYKCTVSLAPETSASSLSGSLGSLGSLASSFGLGSLAKMNSQDAIFSEIYPNVIESKNFIAELMTIEVQTKEGDVKCNYYTYLRDKQKAPWWSQLRGMISEAISPTEKDTANGKEKLSTFNLTRQQNDIFMSVQGKIKCTIDKKTDIVSITVQDQDPLVCATIADATCQKLQDFIVEYRTNKARIDYEYYKRLYEDSKTDYENALAKYAASSDAYTNTVLAVYHSKIERLENDMQAKYNIYTAMNTQMQAAKAKLQEATPAFTVIESASVPVKPAGPKRVIISIFITILAFFVLSGIILIRKR
jgi:hypothetical protein